ncbi:MAG TPA: M1 family metallopeptidase [Polyangiaceae bacterium]|nr:M1 family metallopeptidase [Polyangiaceae bacterium]
MNFRGRAIVEAAMGLAALGISAALLAPPSRPRGAPPEQRPAKTAERAPKLVASYTLNAELDAGKHNVKGSGTIAWQNTSRSPVRSLFFHLYLNAFKNERSVFLRSPFGASRDDSRGRDFGYIDVASLTVRELGNADIWPNRQRHSPGDVDDETDIEVPLPRAVEPGESLTLDLRFESQLPELMERTGYSGSFHFVAQWFPKLARLEDNGEFSHFSFHPQAEFYADFGRYDVTLDVPQGFTVGATGALVSQSTAGGRKRVRYVAEPVHDFAWTAWDGFQEKRFSAGGLDVRMLFPAGQEKAATLSEDTLRFALPYFERRFGSYPYPTLTVMHPPPGAEASGGMEYPTLITTGGDWYTPYLGMHDVQTVVVHEFGHQWFYGILASNEARWPFLDEGLNSYAEQAALGAQLPRQSLFGALGITLSGDSLFRVFAAARAQDEPVGSAASEFSSFRNLGALVYSRTATLLATLERVYGKARFQRALGAYAARFRFAHPTPTDLLDVIGDELGSDARTFLDTALFHRGRVDYVARDLQNTRASDPAGYFERASGREHITRQQAQPTREFVGRATVYRHGSLELPVDVLLVARDGTRKLERWDGHGAFRVFEYRGATELARVVVDPDHKLLIDDDLFNNELCTSSRVLWRVHERLGYFAALALAGVSP